MLQIKTTGVEDFLDGSANIKAMIIGGPGAGKTRMSSYWPKPIFLDCENGRGSLADRNMPYAEIKNSKDMLDALEYLKALERTPKAQRQFQTVVVDTVDSFQRLVKDEWIQQTKAGAFSGYDAWGYLDTKMQLLFTRLLNLDYNVIVLVHYKDKTFKDGENTVREFVLQLQGQIADQVFNDFGLVGYLGTYWATSEEGRVQKRGLTFRPTPDKPFLKDRFHVTPPWMEIGFCDHDYQQLFEAFFNRPEFDELAESQVVGEIPDSERKQEPPAKVAPPSEGGPVAKPVAKPEAATKSTGEVPLEKMTREQLAKVAKTLGLDIKGNALKAEIVAAIREAQTKPPHEKRDAQPASPASTPKNVETTTTSSGQEPVDTQTGEVLTPEQVADRLGGEVISQDKPDAPATPQAATPPTTVAKPTAPTGPSACADCSGDLAADWADPAKKNYVRLSFVKFRRYLCGNCYAQATK